MWLPFKSTGQNKTTSQINSDRRFCRIEYSETAAAGSDTTGQLSVYTTDLRTMYEEAVPFADFASRFGSVNPELEVNDIRAVMQEVEVVVGAELRGKRRAAEQTCCIDYSHTDIGERIDINWESEGIPYVFFFQLKEASADEFFLQVTGPLLGAVGRLLQERGQLFQTIRDKDVEIGEYSNSGVRLSRPDLKTEWFNPEEFVKQQDSTRCSNSFNSVEEIFTRNETQTLLNKVVTEEADGCLSEEKKSSKPELHQSTQGAVKKVLKVPEPTQKQKVDKPLVKVSTKKSAVQKKLMKL